MAREVIDAFLAMVAERKKSWGDGPWQSEPDRIDFRHAGLACFVQRNHMGVLCGYVGVPEGHPAHGKSYDDVDVDVHGGLTYARECHGSVCHVPEPGEPDRVWWFGFDCGHAWDLMPCGSSPELLSKGIDIRFGTYRDLAFARAEVERLAEQLAAIGATMAEGPWQVV